MLEYGICELWGFGLLQLTSSCWSFKLFKPILSKGSPTQLVFFSCLPHSTLMNSVTLWINSFQLKPTAVPLFSWLKIQSLWFQVPYAAIPISVKTFKACLYTKIRIACHYRVAKGVLLVLSFGKVWSFILVL